jgi:broad specificity polyphosphatase/5'/3'-nucleotidase SurE
VQTPRQRLLLADRKMVITDETNDNDIIAIKENYVSITPLHYDLTDYNT